MMDLLFAGWAAREQMRRAQSDSASQRAARVATDTRTQADGLRLDVDRLLLITEALWTILKEQHGYTDEELARRITEIDMRDGRLDGRVRSGGPVVCPKCGRNNKGDRPSCIYCAAPLQADPFRT